jgi:hypothetical protein
MDASRLDKRRFHIGENVVHARSQMPRKDFCHNLGESVDETNRSIVGDVFRPLFLWDEYNILGVYPMQIS